MTADSLLQRLLRLLPGYAYRFSSETGLHEGLALVLTQNGITHHREFVASAADRFDFLVPPGIVIEAKVHGSLSAALPQCRRYLERDDVQAVLLVSNRFWAMQHASPIVLAGKHIHIIKIRGSSF